MTAPTPQHGLHRALRVHPRISPWDPDVPRQDGKAGSRGAMTETPPRTRVPEDPRLPSRRPTPGVGVGDGDGGGRGTFAAAVDDGHACEHTVLLPVQPAKHDGAQQATVWGVRDSAIPATTGREPLVHPPALAMRPPGKPSRSKRAGPGERALGALGVGAGGWPGRLTGCEDGAPGPRREDPGPGSSQRLFLGSLRSLGRRHAGVLSQEETLKVGGGVAPRSRPGAGFRDAERDRACFPWRELGGTGLLGRQGRGSQDEESEEGQTRGSRTSPLGRSQRSGHSRHRPILGPGPGGAASGRRGR